MPSQPAWFHRLDEILADLRSMTSTRLDRAAAQVSVPFVQIQAAPRTGRASQPTRTGSSCNNATRLR